MSLSKHFRCRSWLFVPGDDPRKMAKALASAADIVLLDLEDAVADAEKPRAREICTQFLIEHAAERDRLWIRINPLQSPHALHDLAAVMHAMPGGIMLPKIYGRRDIETLDHYLSALETAAGTEQGATKIIVVATETPDALYESYRYDGIGRLAALTWGAEDLATAIGAISNRTPAGAYDFPYQLARSMCLMGASIAGVPAIETMHADFRDEEGLRNTATAARMAGFRGMIAIHPAQVELINQLFAPSAGEVDEARAITALFAANPTLGTIGYNGTMLDRPHLMRAQAILAMVGE